MPFRITEINVRFRGFTGVMEVSAMLSCPERQLALGSPSKADTYNSLSPCNVGLDLRAPFGHLQGYTLLFELSRFPANPKLCRFNLKQQRIHFQCVFAALCISYRNSLTAHSTDIC